MYQASVYAIPNLISAVFCLCIALLVFLRNKYSETNVSFFILMLSAFTWQIGTFVVALSTSPSVALVWCRFTYIGAVLIPVAMYHFVVAFLRKRKQKKIIPLAYLIATLFFMPLIFTNYLIAGVYEYFWGYWYKAGIAHPLFLLFFATLLLLSITNLFKSYREEKSATERVRKKFVFFAFLIVYIGSVDYLPDYGVSIYPFGYLPLMIYIGVLAYAIAKHRLMDIRLVVLRSVAYSLMVAVFGGSFVLIVQFIKSSYAHALNLDSNIVFVIAGLMAAFGFQPLRRLLERATDKIFYKKRYNPQKLLGDLSMTMSSTIDLNELAMLITTTLKREMKLGRMAILLDGASGREELKGEGFDIPRSSFKKIMQMCIGKRIVIADELEEDAEEKAMLREHDISVLLSLVVENELIGVLLFGNKLSGDMYTTQDVEFLEILASEAAISVKNAELFEEKTMRVRELAALNKLAFTLGTNLNLETILDQALKQIMYVTEADSGSIMLLDEKANALVIKAAKAIKKEVLKKTHVEVGEGIAGWVAKNKEPLILVDDLDPRFQKELKRQEIVSAITVPLIAKEKVIGVLSVNRNKSPELFSKENLNVVNSFAGQLAVAIENARLYQDLESTFLGTISALAAAVDAKDPYTYGHSNDVTEYAVKMAKQLLLPESKIETIRIAATLHDIGKIGIDASILNKPGKLSSKERIIINRHPSIGVNILESLEFLQDVVPLILFHHERFDGRGYPSGITDGFIPLGARIIAVADSFNAMISDRPYRKALSLDQAIKELEDNAGTQFDPTVVSAFLKVLSKTSSKKKSLKSSKHKKPACQKVPHKK